MRAASRGAVSCAWRCDLPALGYALPGTVLALGLLIPLAALDNRIDALSRARFRPARLGLMLSGSLVALVLAFSIRFLAVVARRHRGRPGARLAQSRCRRPHARRDAARDLWRVHLPLLLPALGTRGAAGVRRCHEGAAGDAAAAPLQFRDAGDARLQPRLARAVRERRARRRWRSCSSACCRCWRCIRRSRRAARDRGVVRHASLTALVPPPLWGRLGGGDCRTSTVGILPTPSPSPHSRRTHAFGAGGGGFQNSLCGQDRRVPQPGVDIRQRAFGQEALAGNAALLALDAFAGGIGARLPRSAGTGRN